MDKHPRLASFSNTETRREGGGDGHNDRRDTHKKDHNQ